MDPQQMEDLLQTVEVREVMSAIDDPAVQAKRGWDLSRWAYQSSPSSICFVYWDPQGKPKEALVAVHAPKDKRDRMQHLVADFPLPAKVVMLD